MVICGGGCGLVGRLLEELIIDVDFVFVAPFGIVNIDSGGCLN
jgi:hypothetical protein